MFNDYIWLDAKQNIRNKVKVGQPSLWSFDGSSTGQAEGHKSDLLLNPIKVVKAHFGNIVLCEVLHPDGRPHETNTRRLLADAVEKFDPNLDCWFGFEQEYVVMRDGNPIGWPKGGYPEPQGPYYCGPNAGFGIALDHLKGCHALGLSICGINAEVMLGQHEFQIGPLNALEAADELIIARHLLNSTAEARGCYISLDPKVVEGDWNGSGCHTNFSTKAMREIGDFESYLQALKDSHDLHIAHYGEGIERRLTGKHETCSYQQFKVGVGDRTASIRIPAHVDAAGKGYLEDRRPCANCDPYTVARLLLERTNMA